MSKIQQIKKAIDEYAQAYQKLQCFQDEDDGEESRLIPHGDQKTGCIGEFYARLYLGSRYPATEITFASTNEKGWDIKVVLPNRIFKVQVKTVSEYSKNRGISPIYRGWDELHIIFVGRLFKPTGFWIVDDTNIFQNQEVLKNKKCPDPNNPDDRPGSSTTIPFGENRVAELRDALPWA